MSYATPTNFIAYGLPAVSTADFSGTVQDYLDSAFGEINTYLRGRYTLPFTVTVPIELVKTECVIAAYDLLSVRGFDPENGSEKVIEGRHTKAMNWLMAIADGKINLDIDADTTPGVPDGAPRIISKARADSTRFR